MLETNHPKGGDLRLQHGTPGLEVHRIRRAHHADGPAKSHGGEGFRAPDN